jgi:hypothetical protein
MRDKKANIIAITIVPVKGKEGILMPKAIAITAPSDAPDDTPRVEPSARGFRNSPCIAPPQMERDAPVSATQITLGNLTDRIIDGIAIVSGIGMPQRKFHIVVIVSLMGIVTLPTETQSAKVKNTTPINIIYSKMPKLSFLLLT